jgi:hypothetical protein
MTRRVYQIVLVNLLVGLSLTGIACGGSKEADQKSNAPVGVPRTGEAPPTANSNTASPGASGGSTEMVQPAAATRN